MKLRYKRLLLKLSGEQLAGKYDSGIDVAVIEWVGREIGTAVAAGVQVVIIIGGGNFVRGSQIAGHGISRVTGDYMGMLSTLINGLAVADVFNHIGVASRLLSNVRADQVADQFTPRRAVSHLVKGRVVIVGGGVGRPYLTTDTAAVNLALELDCDVVCKLTKVDGVYDRDPHKHKDAVKLARVSFQDAVSSEHIAVMDKAAMGLAAEHQKPILVFDLHQAGSILRAASGEPIGTTIDGATTTAS